MSAEIKSVSHGILTINISGRLSEADMAGLQQAAADVIRTQGRVRILVLTENFTGWESGGTWDDFSFQEQYDPYIEKMAIVGDRQWEDLALVFTSKGLRKFPIEYFTPVEVEAAQNWLMSDS
jgi:hypothetical protein